MNKIDMHFHSTMSDGKYTTDEVINDAIERKLDFAAITEHDTINTDFPILAKQNWIDSIEWVEISVLDDKLSHKHLHITSYATKFSWEIYDVLADTREWKINRVYKQVSVLKSNWFNIDYEEFLEFCTEKWFSIENLNSAHISNYIFQNEDNIKLIEELTWEEMDMWKFIAKCLKEKSEFKHIWWSEVEKYEPTITEIWKIAKKWWYFLSLAHPNFNFKDDYDLFRFFVEEYADILNGIEINTLASKKWVEVILETVKKHNLILTFGSDDHFIRGKNPDTFHGILWYPNPHIPEWVMLENFKNFLLVTNATQSIKKV